MDYKSLKNIRNKNKFNVGGLLSLIFWLFILTLVFLKIIVFQQVSVVGSSMQPSYESGQTLLMNQINKNYKRGQVVAAYKDFDEAKNADYFTRFNATFFLKRIIALPGESIEIIGGTVIIYNDQYPQGAVIEENYVDTNIKKTLDESQYRLAKTNLGDEEFFLMGDNRTNSFDSRNAGPFPKFAIFGQETLRIWPLKTTTIFSLPEYRFLEIDESLNLKKDSVEQI